jgi:environmental stress-induced protein Ves
MAHQLGASRQRWPLLAPRWHRSIALIAGGGLRLRIDDERDVALSSNSAPFTFRGEQHIDARLLNGPITDFNVITQRTRWAHVLYRLNLVGDTLVQ